MRIANGLYWTALVMFLGLAGVPGTVLGDTEPRLERREKWSAFFAGQQIDLHFSLKSKEPCVGRLEWAYMVSQRVISRGSSRIAGGAGAEAAEVAVPLELPPVKEGASLKTALTVKVILEGDREPLLSDSELWLLADDPFFEEKEWLKERHLAVFDPTGQTVKLLTRLEIPFEQAVSVDALAELKGGFVIVGEGTLLNDEPPLYEVLLRLASQGTPVLCLAPQNGTIPLPAPRAGEDGALERVTFRNEQVVADLDRRLDWVAWPPPAKSVTLSRIAFRAGGAAPVGEVNAEEGWPWLEIQPAGAGRPFVICGFGMIAAWDAGPTPRFLFARLLHYLSGDDLRRLPPLLKESAP